MASAFLRKRKNFLRTLEKLLTLDQLAAAFKEENWPVQTFFKNGVQALLAIYIALKSEDSIDRLLSNRAYHQFHPS